MSLEKSNKNIGVDRYQIGIELRKLLGDCQFWIEKGTYSPDETAVRFKHRIVQIHCFSNGNGRHSRIMGDLIVEKHFDKSVFTWGSNLDPTKAGSARKEYLNAIKEADANNIARLLSFARN